MCGITGAVWTTPREALSEQALAQMTDSLTHRGPDDRGLFYSPAGLTGNQSRSDAVFPRGAGEHSGVSEEPGDVGTVGVGLWFRRLSIIDLATGAQPMEIGRAHV